MTDALSWLGAELASFDLGHLLPVIFFIHIFFLIVKLGILIDIQFLRVICDKFQILFFRKKKNFFFYFLSFFCNYLVIFKNKFIYIINSLAINRIKFYLKSKFL